MFSWPHLCCEFFLIRCLNTFVFRQWAFDEIFLLLLGLEALVKEIVLIKHCKITLPCYASKSEL